MRMGVTIGFAAGLAWLARRYFASPRGVVRLAVKENELRVEYLGGSVRQAMAINFILAAFAGGAGGAVYPGPGGGRGRCARPRNGLG